MAMSICLLPVLYHNTLYRNLGERAIRGRYGEVRNSEQRVECGGRISSISTMTASSTVRGELWNVVGRNVSAIAVTQRVNCGSTVIRSITSRGRISLSESRGRHVRGCFGEVWDSRASRPRHGHRVCGLRSRRTDGRVCHERQPSRIFYSITRGRQVRRGWPDGRRGLLDNGKPIASMGTHFAITTTTAGRTS